MYNTDNILEIHCWHSMYMINNLTDFIYEYITMVSCGSLNASDFHRMLPSVRSNCVQHLYIHFLIICICCCSRNFPRALALSILLITICYTLTNISYIAVLGIDTVIQSKVVVSVISKSCSFSTQWKYCIDK